MTDFHDILFPMRLARGAVCSVEHGVEIIQLASGQEVRQSKWAASRRSWDVGGAVRDLASLQELVSFFEARSGPLHGFRFRDPLDHSSALPGQTRDFEDQYIGTGNGIETRFQLCKLIGSVSRKITKPVTDTVQVSVNGAERLSGWSVDSQSGVVSFESPPAVGDTVSAGFMFDCAVRFGSDRLQTVIEAFGAGRAANVSLIELPDMI
ncbi:MAG: DUF2460 domain-containing protein [Pseudomonadota bacterium]